MSLGAAQGQLMDQWQRIMTIPSVVVSNWPAMISFAIVNYVSDMVFQSIPNPVGGTAGRGFLAVLNGGRDVVNMATWDAVRQH